MSEYTCIYMYTTNCVLFSFRFVFFFCDQVFIYQFVLGEGEVYINSDNISRIKNK